MGFGFTDIDHLMIRVADLDRAVAAYEALGFTVAPPRPPITADALAAAAGAGAAGDSSGPLIDNRLVLFRPPPGRADVANFLELMCVPEPARLPPAVTQMLSFLLDSEGPKSIVCHTDDLDASREAMLAAGLEVGQPVSISTGWRDGDLFVPIRARPAVPVFGQIPFQLNPYETDTVASYRHTRWTEHANSAQYLAGVTGVTTKIAEHARFMAEVVFGVPLSWESDDIAVMHPRDLFLRVVTPAGFAKLYPGLDLSSERIPPFTASATIAVASVQVARDALAGQGIDWIETTDGIAVGRHHAANTVIEFVQSADRRSTQAKAGEV